MSHFPLLVIVKEEEVVTNPLLDLRKEQFEGKEQYVDQYLSTKVDELLSEYWEGDSDENYNEYGKWDWYVVGGRWNHLGDKGYFKDLNDLLEMEEIPFYKTLSFMQYKNPTFTYDSEEEFIKDNIQENTIRKSSDYDQETQTHSNIVYYTVEELMRTVKRKKNDVWSFLTEEEGWIEYGEMGWFGISSLDLLKDDEKEQAIQDTDSLVNNMLKKYIEEGYVGLVVDCHI